MFYVLCQNFCKLLFKENKVIPNVVKVMGKSSTWQIFCNLYSYWKLEFMDITIFDLVIQMNVYIINYIRLYH